MSVRVELWSDGSGSVTGGPGGWAFVLRAIDADGVIVKESEDSGHELSATNNTMELAAVISGLDALTKPTTLTVYSDSEYVVHGITRWVKDWQRNGWRNRDDEPVANQQLWKMLIAVADPHRVTWRHIPGHVKHCRCDACGIDKPTGEFLRTGRRGIYRCKGCGAELEVHYPYPLNWRCDQLAGDARLAAKAQLERTARETTMAT